MDKQFQFLIEDEGNVSVKFDFYKIKEETRHYSINIYNIEEDIRSLLYKGNQIYLTYRGVSRCISFSIIEYSLISTKETFDSIKVKVSLSSCLNVFADNFYAELFYSWKNNDKQYRWDNLGVRKRKLWLNACSSIKNTGNKHLISNTIYLHFKGLKTMLDFYCHFGDRCLGYKGYLGSNLDALDDMLLDLDSKSIEKTIFYLYDLDIFRSKMTQTREAKKYNINYVDEILKIFKEHKINYKLAKSVRF
ncbi:barstar family protein [Tenacibaculum maritimum]|uniref:barstar family protein n=1 Tax=Tenacibaculum maritimum TaxID=107401 RepID=UPI001E4AAF3C|nr:barstar family protein [Tenacibaculum maritimum]MCD9586245.1 barstar family protein [Tenacibaculum maritimum]MCD9620607.1 barstar family protein [Tenacibaculum maritimum]MCD9626017.1 barstar family protein [Tenacibaculum maritimum]MCD9631517.1 barstar family protein [Tenacibaculum maritimum]MCD9634427.1 barstar family protein [Tenacibaculum maritimum]